MECPGRMPKYPISSESDGLRSMSSRVRLLRGTLWSWFKDSVCFIVSGLVLVLSSVVLMMFKTSSGWLGS